MESTTSQSSNQVNIKTISNIILTIDISYNESSSCNVAVLIDGSVMYTASAFPIGNASVLYFDVRISTAVIASRVTTSDGKNRVTIETSAC